MCVYRQMLSRRCSASTVTMTSSSSLHTRLETHTTDSFGGIDCSSAESSWCPFTSDGGTEWKPPTMPSATPTTAGSASGLVSENTVGSGSSSVISASWISVASSTRCTRTPCGCSGHARRTMNGSANVYSIPLSRKILPMLRRNTNVARTRTAGSSARLRACSARAKGPNVGRSEASAGRDGPAWNSEV